MNKLLKSALSLILALQLGLFMPIQAHASFFDEVLNAAAAAGGWPDNLPPPTALIGLINIAQSCTDTSEAGLLNCVNKADENPVTHELLGNNTDKILAGIGIYFDLINGDYVSLISKLGKTAGCAAAAILTGVPVCALLELLADVAGAVIDAVGELGDLAGDFLTGLDGLVFGGTDYGPPPTGDEYYKDFFAPYLDTYVRKAVFGKVDNNTILDPAYQTAVSEYKPHSIAELYADCGQYFKKYKINNIKEMCDSVKAKFDGNASTLIVQGKTMELFVPVAKGILEGYRNTWILKLNLFQDQQKVPRTSNQFIAEVGYFTTAKYPVYLTKYETSIITVAVNAIKASNYTVSPKDALDKAIKDAEPVMQQALESYKKDILEGVANDSELKLKKERSSKIISTLDMPSKKLLQIRYECSSLSVNKNKDKCLNSEPLKACVAYRDSFSDKSGFYTYPIDLTSKTSPAEFDQFITKLQGRLDSCTTWSQKVTDEWKRVSNLYPPFIKGWTDYCNATVKTPQKSECNTILGNYLINAYDGCADSAIEPVSTEAASHVELNVVVNRKGAKSGGNNPKLPKKPSNSLAIVNEQFCYAEGEAAVAQIDNGIFNNTADDPTGPAAPIDPSRAASQSGQSAVRGMRGAPGMIALDSVKPSDLTKKVPGPSTVKAGSNLGDNAASLDKQVAGLDVQNPTQQTSRGMRTAPGMQKIGGAIGPSGDFSKQGLSEQMPAGGALAPGLAPGIALDGTGKPSVASVPSPVDQAKGITLTNALPNAAGGAGDATKFGSSVAPPVAGRAISRGPAATSQPTQDAYVQGLDSNKPLQSSPVPPPEPPFDRQRYQHMARQKLEAKWYPQCNTEPCKAAISSLIDDRIREVLSLLDAGQDLRVKATYDAVEAKMDYKYDPKMQDKVSQSRVIKNEAPSAPTTPVAPPKTMKIKNFGVQ